MYDHIQKTVFHVTAEVAGVNVDDLRKETRFSDLNLLPEDYYEIYEACCNECNVPLSGIINTTPIYRYGAGEYVMSSLRNLAAFSPKASQLLELYDVEEHEDTLESVANSIREQRYVASGYFWPRTQPPRSRRYVYSWVVGLLVAALLIPFLFVKFECSQLCELNPNVVWYRTQKLLPYSIGLFTIINLIAFLPGLVELNSSRANRKLGRAARKD